MKAMVEHAQNRRLLVDSDSDKEPAKPCPNPTAQTKPTDVLQEDPQLQSKKPRTESWEQSVGKLSSKAQLAGLVARRMQKPDPALQNRMETQGTAANTTSLPAAAATSSLDLLGAYSHSEESTSN
ncbi:hypothetical protein DUI87_24768 [Hirundo rustica rustica]|uniref:Uncharacterized protein n=2 Tax=Hirundo rustica TaxID=43150 RepID=A0A3M0JC78_HIRRU|nr:hypothetical protein DUI87_24768 [Hirundo rustica rustica]